MSVLHKIPPLVSALAFGYGVGMSAPESTITSVNAAVVAYQGPNAHATAPAYVAPAPSPAQLQAYGGEESRELHLMRRALEDERRGASCDLDRPMYSKGPRYESRPGSMADDSDDLDGPGVDALSRLQMPDLKVSVSRRTLKYVRFFAKTDRGRGMFETWLKRSGKYQDMVQSELRRRHLPEDLIWLAMIESGFDARAKSPAGAVGLWQFMPATGKVYGLDQNKFIDQRKNPRLATQAAVHHLRDLYLRFQNWDLALAAYNMGYEQLLNAIDRYGTTDFNELARQEAIPSETASYVPKIAAAAIVANNLDRFGFDRVELMRPLDTAEIAVPPGTPLKLVAKASGVSTSVIRNMNPDVLGEKMPPGRGDFLMLIPSDSLSRARVTLPSLMENEPIETDANVLDPVDLLGGRAFKPRGDGDESLLSLLPKPKRRSMRDDIEALGGLEGGDRDGDRDDDIEPSRKRKGRETLMYRVGAGDTLIGIAKEFAIDVEDIARDNKIDSGDGLRTGQLLKLSVRKDAIGKVAKEHIAKDGSKAEGRDNKSERDTKSERSSKADADTKPTKKERANDRKEPSDARANDARANTAPEKKNASPRTAHKTDKPAEKKGRSDSKKRR